MKAQWNEGWQFCLLPLESTYTDFARAEKRSVTLPHDWLIGNTEDLYASGDGWYGTVLHADPAMLDKAVYLDFDGVYMDADVLLRGRVICTHRYGYTAFLVNLTGLLQAGDNEIAVHVRHQSPNSRWYSGAGIFRDVQLWTLPRRHMLPFGFSVNTARDGDGWTLSAGAEMSEAGEAPCVSLLAADGAVIAEGKMDADGAAAKIRLHAAGVTPWSIENPALYRLRITLGAQTEEMSVGFRETRFDPDQGFFLNGKQIKLHGVCLHHDLGALGAAFYEKAAERQLRVMREMGVNAVRTAHNPPARRLLDLCDRMGLVVMDELYDMWELPKTPYDNARFFPETYRQSVAEWVRRDRCHPCVILWSIGNEIYDMQFSDRGQMWTRRLTDEVRRHDAVHAPVTFGSNYMPWEGAQKCAEIVKLPGYNYAEKLYAAHHAAHPDWVIFGSETGSILASRGIYHFPMAADILSDEDLQCSALLNSNTSWGARDIRPLLADDLNTPYTLGQFIWAGIDYLGEPTPYHTRNCYFGQTDTACFPKDSYFFYQAMWTDRPMIHIGVSWDWNRGQMIDVPVMTNAARAELLLNGRSLGVRTVDRRDAEKCLPVWRVPFEKGVLAARGYDENGKLLCQDARQTPGEPVKLALSPEKTDFAGGCGEIAFLTVTALDERGREVENAVNRVHVTVEGPGVLLGLDNGDSADRDGYKQTSRRLFSGRLLILAGVQTGPGKIRVQAESRGLQAAEAVLAVGAGERTQPGFPALCREYRGEDAILPRRIDLEALEDTRLTPEHPSVRVRLRLQPPEADGQEIALRIVNAEGVDMPCARIQRDGDIAAVTAAGDGKMYLRASVNSGYPHPRVLSALEISAEGFGPVGLDPYGFIAGALADIRQGEIGAGNERGISFAREGRSMAGFSNVDFGPAGSDEITLPIFALNGEKYVLGLWDGVPGEGGEKICDLPYQKPSIWNTYQSETYRLPRALRGTHTLCFTLDQKVHLKGFSFARRSRALRWNAAGEADQVYGDSFRRAGDAVLDIGNNVTLVFEHMAFETAGTRTLRIEGRTPLRETPVHVKITGPDGETRTSMCLFAGTDRGVQSFPVEVPAGECRVDFVFLPGTQFDFYGFAMEEA
ncbi:MAG: DUF4982 domain-containing protein [Clostridiales bacterium]|nr:DUF4982 domain-containing protein [Clostridiales bacterium]